MGRHPTRIRVGDGCELLHGEHLRIQWSERAIQRRDLACNQFRDGFSNAGHTRLDARANRFSFVEIDRHYWSTKKTAAPNRCRRFKQTAVVGRGYSSITSFSLALAMSLTLPSYFFV